MSKHYRHNNSSMINYDDASSSVSSNFKINSNGKQKAHRAHNIIPNVHPTNSVIAPDGKIFKVQKKRQRKIYSCIPCHQRKIKCSRETPTCLNCQKLGEKNPDKNLEIISACKYFDNDKKINLKKKGVNFDSNLSIENNSVVVNSNENNITSENNEDFDDVNPDNNNNDNNNNQFMANEFDNDTNDISTNNQYSEFTYDSIIPEYDVKNYIPEPIPTQIPLPTSNPSVSQDWLSSYTQQQQSYFYEQQNNQPDNVQPVYQNNPPLNQNLQAPLAADINTNENINDNKLDISNEINQDKSNDNSNLKEQEENQNNNTQTKAEVYEFYSKQFALQFTKILNNLPTKERSDELLETFKTNIHSLLPILKMETFVTKYDEFWYCGLFLSDNIEKLYQYYTYYKDKPFEELPEKITDFLYWYNKTNCSLNPTNFNEFLILLFAVYYSSISSSVYEFLCENRDNISNLLKFKGEVNQYYNTFTSLNYKGLNNPRVMSLAVLQINVLVQSITNLKAGKSLINIAKILRICQFYQLNRDPVLYHALKESNIIQTRRIVWWQIFFLDNLVSFFLNLPPSIKLPDFDTNLLIENYNNDKNTLFSLMYLNCMFRFAVIVDDLNNLCNGLNYQLKNNDINKMKQNINNLYINCKSSRLKMNLIYFCNTGNNQNDDESSIYSGDSNHSRESKLKNEIDVSYIPDNIKFFNHSFNILSDKMLIMLQKKIVLNPYLIINDLSNSNKNLDLIISSLQYRYTELNNNLLPALLHYLKGFLSLSKKDMMKYNWKLKNYIPIDELILLMQILATNYNLHSNINEITDIHLKIFLIDQTINSFKLNWHFKLSSVNKLISLASNLWELMIIKFNIDLDLTYSLSDELVFPKPVNTPNHSVSEDNLKHSQDSNQQNGILYSKNSSVNCAEVAPRALVVKNLDSITSLIPLANDEIIETKLNEIFQTNNKHIFSRVESESEITCELENMNIDKKERFLKLAKVIEVELSKESNSTIFQETDDNDEGWFNLGTEEVYGQNSIDDFHFFKNLKSDVIRLFKLIVC